MLNFNKRLFTLFGTSNGFQSTGNTKATDTGARALSLSAQLEKYIEDEETQTGAMLPTESKVRNCQASLTSFAAGADQLGAHINTRLDTLLDDMQVAATIKEIDAYIGDVPPSCATIDSVAGSMGEAGDAVLNAVSTQLDDLEQAMSDFDLGVINDDEFDVILDQVTTELNTATAGILAMIASELAAIDGMYKKTRQLANAFAVEALINDPCVRPLIKKFANPDLAAVLTEDFDIEF
ncbi:hypothetical protein [Marinomonas fungiae]|uniref:DUF7217 family protein n=1 Tax=Marinomonas fungiae TaxID=1137284 RepID=UPI003A8EE995